MFRLAIKHGVKVAVAVLIISLIGLVALFRVPIQMIPNMDVTTLSIQTLWPGATPQDIEKEILLEQEKYLRSIPGLSRMTANAYTSMATIRLEFAPGTQLQEILIRVNNALAQVPSYPENVDEPRINTSSSSDSAFLYYSVQPLPGNPKNVDIIMMRDFIDNNIRTAIERTEGVSQVDASGGAARQIKIFIDPTKLAERQISISQLRTALRSRNIDVSGGDIDTGKRRYMIRTIGRFKAIEEIQNVIISERQGTPVYLRDVGFVELSHAEIQRHATFNGQPSITLSIRRQIGANVIEVMDRVTATVDELNQGILKDQGLRIVWASDDVMYVRDAVALVKKNLIIGSILASSVLYIFLRSIPSTLLGALGIPVCTIAAFLGLLVTGRTINVISLAGVAFAIGMTLDNTIVVMENINRHLRKGKSLFDAALDGVSEVWTAVFASTLTTVFVFLPVIFVKEEAGQLYSDIAVAVSASIIMSMLVAIAVVPCAASRWLHLDRLKIAKGNGKTSVGWIDRQGSKISEFLLLLINGLMKSVLKRVTLILLVLGLTLSIIAFLTPKAEYLPEGEEAKIFTILNPPSGYNLGEMFAVSKQIDDFLVPHLNADPDDFDQGKTEVPAIKTLFNICYADRLITVVTTMDPAHIDKLMKIMGKRFGEIPGINTFTSRGSIFSGNLGGTRSIDLDIYGPRLEEVYEVASNAYKRSKEIFNEPQVRAQPGLELGQPLLQIRPDWERVSDFGMDTWEMGYLVSAFSDGAYLDEFYFEDEKIDIFLYGTQGSLQNTKDLDHLLLFSPKGGVLPLSALARVEETVHSEVIQRVDSRRTVTLSIVPPIDVPLEAAVELVQTDLIQYLRDSGKMPLSVNVDLAGASDRLEATRKALTGNFLLAIAISFLLMVAIFSHWGYPLIIMLSVPLGISGGIVGLWLMNHWHVLFGFLGVEQINQPLDMITMLGFLVLIGTVVNNPILIVDQTVKLVETGLSIREAVDQTIRIRLRPILMSTITTIFGLMPLVFLPGAGTELYRGLGAIVLFGLFFSTLITLFFIPSLLSLFLEFKVKRKGSTG